MIYKKLMKIKVIPVPGHLQYLKSSIFANLIIYLSEVKENSTINEDE